MDLHYLSPLFAPKSIVVFAGPPDQPERQTAYGRSVCAQLRDGGYDGALTFLDVSMTGTLADLVQSRADLALIALPHEELAFALEVAGRIQCKSALIVSSGVSPALAAELQAIARKHDLYLLGPNSLGFQRPRLKLNAGVAGKLAQSGSLALISQSGALTSAILDWAGSNSVGLSAVVSLGPNTAVDLAQTLDFLATDPATESIVIYMEGITDARRFLSALRGTANTKPVVIIKSGNAAASSRAAATHSGMLIGSDEVFDAALRRTGAVRVSTFVQLFSAAKCLASRYRPVGPRLAVISNGGGPGVLAADWLGKLGLQLARPGDATAGTLAQELPPHATLTDLVDLSEEAGAQHYAAAIRACAADPQVDGLLAIYSPKLDGDPLAVAQGVTDAAKGLGKPLLACWMGDERVAPARHLIAQSGLANFRTPEAAVDGFGNIAAFYQNQQLMQQTPPPLSQLAKPDLEGARRLVESVLAERRSVLTEMESKALLAAFHIPITPTMPARSAAEAQLIAAQLGYPVALKIDSPDIPHKSEVQGVVLNIGDAAALSVAYGDMLANVRRLQPGAAINGVTVQRMAGKRDGRELYIGVASDPLFGPVIGFGAGGTMVELLNDRAVELPPLNQFLAQRLIHRARVAITLDEWRGAPAVDMQAIEHILLRVSEMVCELPQLRELDINPLIVDQFGVLAVDARVVVGVAPPSAQRYDQLAIMPYPANYASAWPMRGGGEYTLRPVQPTDAEMLQALVRGLSDQSRYNRFASSLRELSAQMLARYSLIDYDREMALVAVLTIRTADDDGSFTETEQIIGVSRYIANPDRSSCEFSLLVDDKFSGQGLGTRLMLEIMDVARDRGLSETVGLVLRKNRPMLKLMASLGFQIRPYDDDPDVLHAISIIPTQNLQIWQVRFCFCSFVGKTMELKNWPVLLAVLALAACSKGSQQAEEKAPPPAVTVLALAPSTITLNDDLPGRVAAYRTADIRPQVGGIVLRRLFEQGTEVQAGQPLFQLNPAPLKAEFDTAAAALQHAQATLARAARQAERLQPLIDADAISRQAYDDAVSDRDLAAANVAQAKATLERKRLDLAFATVQAPISGRIGQELVSEGALVGQSDANPMARILQIDKVYVDVRQPASMLASLHAMRAPGQQQTAVILSADGQPYKADAKVLFADLNVDAGTGDATIRILVENPDRALLPGMFVRARIARAAPSAQLLVPQQAVQRSADGHASVWTLDKTGKASQRAVTVGDVINHQYLVRTGLAAGDTLVIEGQERLQQGVHARPLPWKAPAQVSAAPAAAPAAKR